MGEENGRNSPYLRRPHLLFVSQKVEEIRIPSNGQIEETMGKLRSWLHRHSFIPGDKISANLRPISIENGTLIAEIVGEFLSSNLEAHIHIAQSFPLGLTDYDGSMKIDEIFSSLTEAQVDDGGNVQNMILNIVSIIAALGSDFFKLFGCQIPRITIASSSDPFLRLPEALAGPMRQLCDIYLFDLPDRFAVQIPWEEMECEGTLTIASEPHRTDAALQRLIETQPDFKKAFRNATCFVSSDPIHDQISRYANPPFAYVINASTAFRSLVVTESYNQAVILPMNSSETANICKSLLQRATGTNSKQIALPQFPTPLKMTFDKIDMDALIELDHSIEMYLRYNPLFKCFDTRPSFTCPISFGSHGGLVISVSGTGYETIACFTSVPSTEGGSWLINEFGDPDLVITNHQNDVGAGDAVAAIITIFNTIDPTYLIVKFMEQSETENVSLMNLSRVIFVGVLGRIAGHFLLQSERTFWSNIRSDAFSHLLREAAEESLLAARSLVNKLQGPAVSVVTKWGIRIVTWYPGQVAH